MSIVHLLCWTTVIYSLFTNCNRLLHPGAIIINDLLLNLVQHITSLTYNVRQGVLVQSLKSYLIKNFTRAWKQRGYIIFNTKGLCIVA